MAIGRPASQNRTEPHRRVIVLLMKNFYPALMETANAVLNVVAKSRFKGIPSEILQYYHVSHPDHLKGGVMGKKGLSPDLVLLHNNRPPPCPGVNKSLHWANPLQVLEVKPYDNALCDGKNMPRLVVGGKRTVRSSRVWLRLIWEQGSIRFRTMRPLPQRYGTVQSVRSLPQPPLPRLFMIRSNPPRK